jgi:hypothetical protein
LVDERGVALTNVVKQVQSCARERCKSIDVLQTWRAAALPETACFSKP